MSLQRIKNEVQQSITELFATASVDELTGDMEAYRAKLDTIGQIAELLGISTEVVTVTLQLTQEPTTPDAVE